MTLFETLWKKWMADEAVNLSLLNVNEQLEDWVRRNQGELEMNLRRARLECKHYRDKTLGVCAICGEVMR